MNISVRSERTQWRKNVNIYKVGKRTTVQKFHEIKCWCIYFYFCTVRQIDQTVDQFKKKTRFFKVI